MHAYTSIVITASDIGVWIPHCFASHCCFVYVCLPNCADQDNVRFLELFPINGSIHPYKQGHYVD